MLGFLSRYGILIKDRKGKDGLRDEDNNLAVEDLEPTKPYIFARQPLGFLQLEGSEADQIQIRVGFLIGRDSSCHLTVPDLSASRIHASVLWQGNNWLIQDLDSTNGTLVNGSKISSSPLRSGDRIQIGQTVLVYEER